MKNEEEITHDWFKEHIATVAQYGELQVLDWHKPGTNIFRVRYVFDGSKMYVSGDLGEAVFGFSQVVNVPIVAHYSLDYFEEKMRAFTDARRVFNQEKAKRNLTEYQADYELDKHACKEVLDMIDDCSSVREWEMKLADFDWNRLGNGAWEWLPGIGDDIPLRVRAYLIGIKMAEKQIS